MPQSGFVAEAGSNLRLNIDTREGNALRACLNI